ncbi:MAG: phosphatidylserine decarboxylase [Ruminococcus sp.]|nr:phosphatidylserine decarboxylase [Ruminococcus sp.]
MIKDRNGNLVITGEKQNKVLERLYGTVGGRLMLKLLTAPAVSSAAGGFMDSTLSKPLIRPFIKRNNIDTSQYRMRKFSSYNEFFTRAVKPECRPVDTDPEHFISPCDSKLTVYRIEESANPGLGSIFRIKGSYYRITDLLQNEFLAKRYSGGLCMIFRLEVSDYHRYCYADSGVKGKNHYIPGELHTVNPIALRHYNIYKRNAREYTMIHTRNFGDIIQMEVGAMMVGRIRNYHAEKTVRRGEEKGMFMFGGSTIIVLAERNMISIDSDIVRNSAEDTETVVKYGERIGVKYTGR